MIWGFVRVEGGAVVTHKDSYLLSSLSVVSVRRPFFVPVIMLAGGLTGYAAAFADLLYPGEIGVIAGLSVISTFAAGRIGQLKLLSRDLRGSPLGDVMWGDYATLNKVRTEIAAKLDPDSTGGMS